MALENLTANLELPSYLAVSSKFDIITIKGFFFEISEEIPTLLSRILVAKLESDRLSVQTCLCYSRTVVSFKGSAGSLILGSCVHIRRDDSPDISDFESAFGALALSASSIQSIGCSSSMFWHPQLPSIITRFFPGLIFVLKG